MISESLKAFNLNLNKIIKKEGIRSLFYLILIFFLVLILLNILFISIVHSSGMSNVSVFFIRFLFLIVGISLSLGILLLLNIFINKIKVLKVLFTNSQNRSSILSVFSFNSNKNKNLSILECKYTDVISNQLPYMEHSSIFSKKTIRVLHVLLFFMIFISSVFFILFPNTVINSSNILLNGVVSEIKIIIGHSPKVGDIRIEYIYPSYVKRKNRISINSSTKINAIKGTKIKISAKLNRTLISGRVEFDDQDIDIIIKDKEISFKLIIIKSGAYKVFVKDSIKEYLLFNDTIIKNNDKFPNIDIIYPVGAVSISRNSLLDIHIKGDDDFGISRLGMEVYQNKNFNRISIINNYYGKRIDSVISVDLRNFINQGNDFKIKFYLYDNDAISGRKIGRSEFLDIFIINQDTAHINMNEKLKQFTLNSLQLLAAHLTEGYKKNNWNRYRNQITHTKYINLSSKLLATTNELIEIMDKDEYISEDVFNAIIDFETEFSVLLNDKEYAYQLYINRDYDRKLRHNLLISEENETSLLENILFFLSEQENRDKILDVLSKTEEMLQTQERMEKIFENENDSEKISALKKEFNKLLEDIKDIMNNINDKSEKEKLPDEFLNNDAIKNLPSNELDELMKELNKALKEGDVDKAKALMSKLKELLEEMNSSMDMAAMDYSSSENNEELENLEKTSKELNELIKRQEDLNKSLNGLLKKYSGDYEKLKNTIKKQIKINLFELYQDLIKNINLLKRNKSLSKKENLTNNKLLRQVSISYSHFSKDSLNDAVQNIYMALMLNEQLNIFFINDSLKSDLIKITIYNKEKILLIIKELKTFNSKISESLKMSGQLSQKELAAKENSIKSDLKSMESMIKSLMDGMPNSSDNASSRNFSDAMSALFSAESKLKSNNLPGSIPSANSASYQMRMIKGKMKQRASQIKKQMGMSSKGKRKKPGRTGYKPNSVELDAKNLDNNNLRNKIKKALREKRPKGFERATEKYYEKLGN